MALVYHGVPHVVMLATPADLEDYAVGFTLSEGLVARPEEIRSVEVAHGGEAIEVRIAIAWERYTELLQRRRNLTGRTGCGVCGAETVEQAVRPLAPVREGPKVSTTELHDALEAGKGLLIGSSLMDFIAFVCLFTDFLSVLCSWLSRRNGEPGRKGPCGGRCAASQQGCTCNCRTLR